MLESGPARADQLGSPGVQSSPLGKWDLLVDSRSDQCVHGRQLDPAVDLPNPRQLRLDQGLSCGVGVPHGGEVGGVEERCPPGPEHHHRAHQRFGVRSRPEQPILHDLHERCRRR